MSVQPNTRIIYFNRFTSKWCYDVVNSKEDMNLFVNLLIERFDENYSVDGVEYMNINGHTIDVYTDGEKVVEDHKIWDEIGGPVASLDKSVMYKWEIYPVDVFVSAVTLMLLRNGSMSVE